MDQIAPEPFPDVADLIKVGRVGRPHGLRGEMKLVPLTDDPDRITGLATLQIGRSENEAAGFEVKSMRVQPFKKEWTVVFALTGIDTREGAERLRGNWVYARRAELPETEADEWFLFELVGLVAKAADGAVLGQIEDVLEAPAHNVLLIRAPDGSEVLIPDVPEFVPEVRVEDGYVTITPIEGMFDDDAS